MTDDPASLSNLRDLALPPPVPWWPPAPGWWILAAAVLVAGVLLAARVVARHRADAYRRAALRELAAIERDIGTADAALVAQRMAALLKRAALAAFAREDVAGLSGPAWLAFLDRTGRTDAFTAGPGRHLPDLAYGAARDTDGAVLRAAGGAARQWLRDHRRPGRRPERRADGAPC